MRKRMEKRLMDRLLDAYIDWREACRVVNDAYRSWASATGVRAGAEFVRYSASLDREEFAADAYADLVRRVSRIVSSAPSLASSAWGDPWP